MLLKLNHLLSFNDAVNLPLGWMDSVENCSVLKA